VRALNAIDGTPVLDVKPYMTEFAPREQVRPPAWSHQLMSDYWTAALPSVPVDVETGKDPG
jgi:tRNA (Thr-GGU) A37 N-methylase